MAAAEKSYEHDPTILWNLVGDIVEMRKGTIKQSDAESMVVDTEMYGIQTEYVFRVVPSPSGGVAVTVETEGESADDKRRLELMFATLENMLGLFEKVQ